MKPYWILEWADEHDVHMYENEDALLSELRSHVGREARIAYWPATTYANGTVTWPSPLPDSFIHRLDIRRQARSRENRRTAGT